MVLFNIFICFY